MCVSLNYTTEGNTTTIIFKLQSVFLIIFSALRSSLACTGLQQDKTPNLKLKDPEESCTVLDKVWSPVHPHIFSLAICCVSVWDRNRQLCAYWWMFLWKRKKKKKDKSGTQTTVDWLCFHSCGYGVLVCVYFCSYSSAKYVVYMITDTINVVFNK